MYTLSPETIKYADALAVEKYGIADIALMRNAAKSCYEYIYPRISKSDKTVILCGKGNNGGDGYEIAHLLKKSGFDVCVINVFDTPPTSDSATTVYESCLENDVRIAMSEEWKKQISNATVIIDALFGVGFYGCIEENSYIGKLISTCNKKNVLRIAIDTPSGINSANGNVQGVAFMADFTVTMAYIKTGMLSYPAREYCGDIFIADIGYPKELCDEIRKDAIIPDDEYVMQVIPRRKSNTHKGTYGRLLMYCGCETMTGAAILAAKAALRSGVGLVNIARDKETIKILQNHLVEPIFSILSDENCVQGINTLSASATATLIGCGMGKNEKSKDVLFSLIKNSENTLIIDADGINALCENTHILREAKCTPILTPHPLEFARLTGKTVAEIQSDRINLAKQFSKDFGCVLVLKGASTVVCSPDGLLSINTSGNPGLSKGGSGDVLAGLIASLRAQGISEFDSAVLGVYLHGKAADTLKGQIGEYGLLPSDLPMAIAKLLP